MLIDPYLQFIANTLNAAHTFTVNADPALEARDPEFEDVAQVPIPDLARANDAFEQRWYELALTHR